MNFDSAKEFLDGKHSFEAVGFEGMYEKVDLGRVRFVLNALRLDLTTLKIVHVAGSKGKGTVCKMVYDYLRLLDKKVGLFSSPHLMDVRERIMVDAMIDGVDFAECCLKVKRVSEKVGVELSYFEFLFLMALVFFVKEGVEYVVLEVGLGGRLDATNVVFPEVAVIMRIEKEHTEVLGESYREIVNEKLGICKPGVLVVVGDQNEEVKGLICESLKGREVCFQKDNDGVVWEVVRLLLGSVDEVVFERMLRKFVLLGRYDVRFIEDKTVVLDVAHTACSMDRLVTRLMKDFGGKKFKILFGCLKGKDVSLMFRELRRLDGEMIFVNCDSQRGFFADDLRGLYGDGVVFSEVEAAFSEGVCELKKDQIFVVTGSHFLVGAVLKLGLI